LSIQYSPRGAIKKVVDAKNSISSFDYDLLGRVVKKTLPTGKFYEYSYDSRGNRILETDPNGNTKKMFYDVLNRLTRIELVDDIVEFSYDGLGRIVSAKNNVSKIDITPDTLGRIASESIVGMGPAASYPAVTNGYSYDNNGARTQMNSTVGTVSYQYDQNGKLIKIQGATSETFGFAYDELGRISQITRPGTSNRSLYKMGTDSILSQIEHQINGIKRDFAEFNYDNRDLVATKTDGSGMLSYSLDSNGQILQVTSQTDGPLETFSFDEIGNRISNESGVAYIFSANNQELIDDGKFTYQYDNNGNVISKTSKGAEAESFKFYYSSQNQLIKVDVLIAATSAVAKEISYRYDVYGRRIQKVVIDFAFPSDISKTYSRSYAYDGSNIIGEYNSSGVLLARYTQDPRGIDNVLSVNVTSAGVAEKVAKNGGIYYLLKDNLGSVTSIQDGNGVIVQKYKYQSYGTIASVKDGNNNDIQADPTLRISFSFTGREFEKETGLYYYRSRFYDPGSGRFLQRDKYAGDLNRPISVANAYAYAGNNPINFTDPTGNDPVSTIVYNPGGGGPTGGSGSSSSGDGIPLGWDTTTTVVVIGTVLPASAKGVDAINSAISWIRQNDPGVLHNYSMPIVVNSGSTFKYINQFLPDKYQMDGLTLGNLIFLDTVGVEQADLVGMVAHELLHARDGLVGTLFNSEAQHDKIYDRQSLLVNAYKQGIVPKKSEEKLIYYPFPF
jgi:RHS repeat-associated protein